MRPKHIQPPRIYGLPETHKSNILLRPIVSYVNTFAWFISLFSWHLSSLNGKSDYTVKNSAHFVSTSNKEKVDENEIMVSFDVESLFTNVPIEGAVRATLWKLESDLSFPNHTTLTAAQIDDLPNFVLRSTYFQYDGAIYEQDGAAMWSPVSAVIAIPLHRGLWRTGTTIRANRTKDLETLCWWHFYYLRMEQCQRLSTPPQHSTTIRFTVETEKDWEDLLMNSITFLYLWERTQLVTAELAQLHGLSNLPIPFKLGPSDLWRAVWI